MNNNKNSRFSFNITRSLDVFVILIISFIAVTILKLQNVVQGEIYFYIILSSIVVFVLYTFFIQEEKRKDIEYPFSLNLLQSEFSFFMGVIFVSILNLMFILTGTATRTYTIIKPFVVFSSTGTNIVGQTFNVIALQLSEGWNVFFTTVVAGFWETWIFNIVLIIIGVLIGELILNFIPVNWIKFERERITFKRIIAFVFAGLLFIVTHKLNLSYQGAMFIVAFVFLLVMNILLYYADDLKLKWIAVFMFVAGVHMTNNSFSIGIVKSLKGLFLTDIGWYMGIAPLFILMFIHLISSILFNWKESKKKIFEE